MINHFIDDWSDLKALSEQRAAEAQKEYAAEHPTADDVAEMIEDAVVSSGSVTSEIVDSKITAAITEDNVRDDETYAKKSEIVSTDNFATKTELADYALKSEIPTVPSNVSELTNDAGYLTESGLTDYAKTADIDIKLADYALKSEIPTVPTNVSEFTNDAGYLTEHQDLSEYAKSADVSTAIADFATKTELQSSVDAAIAKVVDGAGESFDTLKEIADWIATDETKSAEIVTALEKKAEKTDVDALLALKADKTEIPSLDGYALETYVDSAVATINSALDLKANKTDVDTALAEKADTADLANYATTAALTEGLATKAESGDYAINSSVNTALDSKANKTDVDTALAAKANSADVYSKTEADTLFLIEDDLSGYAKTADVNTSLGLKADKTDLETLAVQATVDAALAEKVNTADVYSKTDADSTFATIASLTDYAKSADVTTTLADYAKTADVNTSLALKADTSELANYATTTALTEGLATKQATGDYATNTVVNASLELKADKTYVDENLTLKANVADVYTQSVIDTKFTDYATTASVTEGLAAKANSADVYTKTESDAKYLTTHQDLSEYAKTADVNTALEAKANKSDVDASLATKQDVGDYALSDDLTEAIRNISRLTTRIEYLESQNTTMTYADSAETISSITVDEAATTDLVITGTAAIEAMVDSSVVYQNIAIVGADTSTTVQINATSDLTIDNIVVSGSKDSTNGKVNFSGETVTIKNVTVPSGSTIYNVFEGTQVTNNSKSYVKTFVADNVQVDNTDLAHNVFNIYTPAESASITISNSSFNLNVANSNILRLANYMNVSNVSVTFKNVNWTYENVESEESAFKWAGLILFQPHGNDAALSGDETYIKTWSFTFEDCYYNGEKVTANNFGAHNQVMYFWNVSGTNEFMNPEANGYTLNFI